MYICIILYIYIYNILITLYFKSKKQENLISHFLLQPQKNGLKPETTCWGAQHRTPLSSSWRPALHAAMLKVPRGRRCAVAAPSRRGPGRGCPSRRGVATLQFHLEKWPGLGLTVNPANKAVSINPAKHRAAETASHSAPPAASRGHAWPPVGLGASVSHRPPPCPCV